jgi:carbon storage regulator
MLILTRKMGEEICIGESVIIKILNLNCHGIEIGIEAPRNMNIVRKEIKNRALPINSVCELS